MCKTAYTGLIPEQKYDPHKSLRSRHGHYL
jgi:hypothetical protein